MQVIAQVGFNEIGNEVKIHLGNGLVGMLLFKLGAYCFQGFCLYITAQVNRGDTIFFEHILHE